MTNTANRRRVVMPSDIRKKFTAALAMLLIAAIMLVASTYAWFTLSTAPEVTGITTNVGANGNLEIALLNNTNFLSGAADLGVQTNVGDSMDGVQTIEYANGTWGNLVDLSPASYGLSNIVLSPAALNITNPEGTADAIGSSILYAPTYGSDGRVMTVDKATVTGPASGTGFAVSDAYNGVRAIGVSSGITLRMSSYANARANISVNMQNARNAASASLVDNGVNLGGLLMKVAATTDPSTVTFTREEVGYFDNMLTSLEAANAYVLTAAKQATIANALSAANTAELTDEQVSALIAAINGANRAGLAAAAGGTLPASVTAVLDQYDVVKGELDTARGNYTSLTTGANESKTEYTYAEISPLLNALINKSNVSVAGVDNPDRDDIGALADAATSGNPVEIVMKPGSGIYVDLAKNAGNYNAGPMRIPVTYSGLSMNLTVNMSTQAAAPILLQSALTAADEAGSPAAGDGATAIDDTYGYALDLGFRTNAAGSKLLLQQAQKQRVYNVTGEESDSDLTQGGGSYVEFTSTNINTFSVDEMRGLMSAMRIVFAEPTTDNGVTTYSILGIAAPEIESTTDNGTGVTTYTGGSVSGANNDTVKVQLALYEYSASAVNGSEVMVTLGDKRDDVELTDLEQNVGKKITVIVYLDGDMVDNTMVANALQSMTGKLNLQFASDHDLVPMENTALRAGSNSGAAPTPAIPATVTKAQLNTAVSTVKANAIYTDAAAAAEPTAAQTTLLTRVTEAEAVIADDDATDDQIKTAAQNLAIAYIAAGGSNPVGA